jgi:hypothetical protein
MQSVQKGSLNPIRQQFLDRPDMIRDPGCHCWRHRRPAPFRSLVSGKFWDREGLLNQTTADWDTLALTARRDTQLGALRWQVPQCLGFRFHKCDCTNLVCFDLAGVEDRAGRQRGQAGGDRAGLSKDSLSRYCPDVSWSAVLNDLCIEQVRGRNPIKSTGTIRTIKRLPLHRLLPEHGVITPLRIGSSRVIRLSHQGS